MAETCVWYFVVTAETQTRRAIAGAHGTRIQMAQTDRETIKRDEETRHHTLGRTQSKLQNERLGVRRDGHVDDRGPAAGDDGDERRRAAVGARVVGRPHARHGEVALGLLRRAGREGKRAGTRNKHENEIGQE